MKRQLAFGLFILMFVSLACRVSLTPTPPPGTPLPPTATITLTPTPTETPTPTPTSTPPLTANGPALIELHMFTTLRGWGLTEDQILITHSSGIDWVQVPLPGITFGPSVSSYFVNADIAYFLVPIPEKQISQLFNTRDGGATWQTTAAPFGSAKLYFPDDNTGFALQTIKIDNNLMSVAIYQTLDRGVTWTQVFIHAANADDKNLPITGIKTGMSFIDPSQGFIGLQAQENSVGLYHAQDAGRTWTKEEISVPDDLGGTYQSTVLPPFFFYGNTLDGVLPVDFQTADSDATTRVFYTTHDAGVTWQKGGEIQDCTAYFFADAQTGWAWGGQAIYATTDGANTWQKIPAAFNHSERARLIDFVNRQDGWLLTIDGKNVLRMYQTDDGGTTWIAIIS